MEPDEHNDEIEDPIPALIAAIDQMLAVMPQQARAAYGIFQEYTKAGFDDAQAIAFTLEYVRSWL